MRQFSVLLFFLLSICLFAGAEQVHDKAYKYKITLPDAWTVQHSGENGFNLRAASPDSSTFVSVFTMDAANIKRNELDDVENTKLSYREEYIDTLDHVIYNLPEQLSETRSRWIKRIERTYQLAGGGGMRTVTYYDDDIPHLISIYGDNIDSEEADRIIESFSTPKMRLSAFAKWCFAIIAGLCCLLFFLSDSFNKTWMVVVAGVAVSFLILVYLCHELLNLFYIPYWIA
ncbi:MAG: hypothetical protein K2J38_06055 [Muribaculaceae bacterium]|nr:hypothetical protein [Muribaculaceae bacterium]